MSHNFFFELIRKSVARGMSLESIEALVATASPNWTNEKATCLEIEIADVASFDHWNPGDGSWIIRNNNGNTFRPFVVALIIQANLFSPLARVYFSQLSKSEAISFLYKKEVSKFQVINITSQEHLDQMIDAHGARKRIQDYQASYDPISHGLLSQYLEGRIADTFVSNVDVLDSEGHCLVCGKLARNLMITTISYPDKTAGSICFSLCQEHSKKAMQGFLVDFLAKSFGVEVPGEIVPIEETDATARLSRLALEELECDLIKEDLPRQTFYGRRRRSGVEVILRCYTEKSDSYAYMVLTPSGPSVKQKNIRRIDNAKDHPDQQFLWDHRHKGLPKNNKDVEPSFTFGMPFADLNAIRREIEEAEAEIL